MSGDNTSRGTGPLPRDPRFAQEIADFIDFLDDVKPPLFVSESLSTILRTEPPVQLPPQRVSDLVASWAEKRTATTGKQISELMLDATRKIVEAYRAGTIQGFDPKLFYRPFVLSLTARVPMAEREAFQHGLKGLQESLPRRWANKPTAEYEGTDVVEIRGVRMSHEAAVNELLARLERNPHMPADEYAETMRDLEVVLSSRVGIPVHQVLERLAHIAAQYFDLNLVARSSQLFEAVHDSFERLNIAKDKRADIRNSLPSARVDRAIFAKWAADHENFLLLRPVVQFFPDFGVEQALKAVADERARDRRKMLLSVLEIQGVEALPLVIERLTEQKAGDENWYFTRNLLYLVSRIDPPADADRRKVLALVGHYATVASPQLRQAAVAALSRIGGREVIPYLTKALDSKEVPEPVDSEGKEALKAHLKQVVEVLSGMDSDAALALAAEVAIGLRAEEFGFGRELRDAAVNALAVRPHPLPRRPAMVLVNFLRQQSEKKIKIVVGNLGLGVDIPGCRAAIRLLANSTEPEAREVLETPFVKKLSAKATAELMNPVSPED